MNEDATKVLELWMDSDLKVQIVVFFRDNPGVIETLDGLAARLGVAVEALRKQVDGHLKLGILQESKVQGMSVLVFDRKREAEVRSTVEHLIRERTGVAA